MPLPAEWYVKIKGRRVLLYRIEKAELLFEGQLALSRLETVMKGFAGKSDVALWILNDTYLEQVVALMTDREKCLYSEMCDETGMNIGTFFMVYVRRALRGRRISFDISAPLILFILRKI